MNAYIPGRLQNNMVASHHALKMFGINWPTFCC